MTEVSLEMSASNNDSRICYNNGAHTHTHSHTNTHRHKHTQTSINTTRGANCRNKTILGSWRNYGTLAGVILLFCVMWGLRDS